MRAKSFHEALCERRQETSQNTFAISYECVLNLSMRLIIGEDMNKHPRTHAKLVKKRMLNLSLGPRIAEGVTVVQKYVQNLYMGTR